jgi:hypothetical protein
MDNIIIGICGGFQAPQDTEGILNLWTQDPMLRVIPALVLGSGESWAPLSAHALRQSLDQALVPIKAESLGTNHPPAEEERTDLILWAFSAGCVGAVALAHHWQRYRGTVRAIFLVDGWGVPWHGAAQLHRISHDAFTHHSSRLLGAGRADFVAQPAVPHRQLWRSPQTVMGLGEPPPTALGTVQPWSAADFWVQWTRFYALPALAKAEFLRG